MLRVEDYSDTMRFPFLPSDQSDQVELPVSRNRSFPYSHSLNVAICVHGVCTLRRFILSISAVLIQFYHNFITVVIGVS